jgi:3-oxoadipate enol-lactonase
MPQFTHAGYSLDYNDYGPAGKVPVVLIHGFPFSQLMWRPQVEHLKSHFRIVTYDNRGHGRSAVGDGQYLIEYFVDDLIALLDQLGAQQAVLCGLSMGGYIALRAVERNPDRVKALVLADTRSEADSNEAKLKRAANIRTVKEKGVAEFAEGFLKAVFTKASVENKLPAVDEIRRVILANPPLGICGTLLALAARTDTTANLPQIKVPTLILVGDQDPVTPPAASESMHRAIPSSELHLMPNSSHMSNLESPDSFNSHLHAFLTKLI